MGGVVSIIVLGALALDFDVLDEFTLELELLFALLLVVMSADDVDVCGLVFAVLLVAKPLLPPSPAPPPQALKSDMITAPSRLVNLEGVILIMRYYLLHATAIDEIGLKELTSI